MEIDVEQFEVQFSTLLEKASADEDVIVTVNGKAVARLVAIASEKPSAREVGSARGEFTVPDDFNEPLPKDIEGLFYQ